MTANEEQWGCISVLLEEPAETTGRPLLSEKRVLVGTPWRVDEKKRHHLLASYPPQQTSFEKQLSLRKAGVLDDALRILVRGLGG